MIVYVTVTLCCLGPLPKGVPVRTLLSPVREVATPPPSPSYNAYDDTISLSGNFTLIFSHFINP